jgi:general secretion pathway protein D
MTRDTTLTIPCRPGSNWRRSMTAGAVLGVAVTLASCAGQRLHRQGMDLFATGHYQEGLDRLAEATRQAPDNLVYRMAYSNARNRLLRHVLAEAAGEQAAGRLDAAERLYQRAAGIDPEHAEVRAGLESLARTRRHAAVFEVARELAAQGHADAALDRLGEILEEHPGHLEASRLQQQLEAQIGRAELVPAQLAASFRTPVQLEFRDAQLKQVLAALSHYGGLNFVVDKDIPETLLVTVFLRDVSLADAIDLILTTHQLRRRTLNDNSLLIYPDTPAKQGEHQELVVKNVFLGNANAKQVETTLKTVLKMRNVFADDRLNLLIMRDTPEMIRVAERIVTTQDVQEPEVMLEVAIVEVKRSSLRSLGIQFPNQLSLAPLASGDGALTLEDLRDLNSSRIGAAITPLILNLQDFGDVTNLLANPRIRARNREKSMIRIGDRVPVITTTATSTGFLSENVQYIDVGLMLEVEPTIYPGDEVAIKLNLDVSSVVKEVISPTGSVSYQIGGRTATTALRLKNGETQILGGLINDEDRRTANRFPGLSQLPLIGRLFASESDNNQKTELLLSITPRVIRSLAPPAGIPAEFWSGTENAPSLRPPQTPRTTLAASPAVAAGSDLAPAAAALSQAAEPVPQMLPVLRWRAPPDAVKSGDSFSLTLEVDSRHQLQSLPLRFSYDKSVFELLDILPGGFMAQGKVTPTTDKGIDNQTGQAYLSQVRPAPPGSEPADAALASGQGELAVLNLRALQATPGSRILALPGDLLGSGEPPLGPLPPVAMDIVVQP